MNRRFIILVIIGALLLAAMGWVLYAVSKKQNNEESPETVSRLVRISDAQVISPIASFDGSAIWYFTSDGHSFRINTDGSGLVEFPLPAIGNAKVSKVIWSRSGSDFIAVTTSPSGSKKLYYNNAKKSYATLPDNIQSLDWLPDNRKVAYVWQATDKTNQQLVTANADSTGFVAVKTVFWPDLMVKVSPDGKQALLLRSQIDGNVNKIYLVNLSTGEFSTLVEQGKNLDVMWVSSNRFLFTQSAVTPYPKVYLFDLTTKLATDLAINTNLDKLAVDSQGQNIYAAMTQTDNSGDRFIKFDLTNFKPSDFFVPDEKITAKNLMMIGNFLYFVNNSDGGLYSIAK